MDNSSRQRYIRKETSRRMRKAGISAQTFDPGWIAAHRDKQMLLSIPHKLKRNNFILRASYESNNFHAYEAKDFQQKASYYMKQMGI